MIAKSYKLNDTEIIMTTYNANNYNVIRIVKGVDANLVTNQFYETADEIFEYWLDMEKGEDK